MTTRTTQFLRPALAAAALLISGADVFAGSVLDRINQRGSITIGYRDDSLPFSYKNTENGPPLGYSIEVCVALAEAIKPWHGALAWALALLAAVHVAAAIKHHFVDRDGLLRRMSPSRNRNQPE